MNLNNLTYTVAEHNFTSGSGFSVFSVLGPILLTWDIIANILLLVSVLSSATLRRQLRVQLIICLSICDLTTGALSTGIFSYIAYSKVWNFGCPFHYLVQIIGVFADIFLATWYLVILLATFFLDLMHVPLPKLSPLGDKLMRVILMVSPVIVFCITGLPIIFSHPGDVRPTNEEFCPLFLENTYEIAMSFLCFFLPATSIAIFCVIFVIFRNETTLSRDVLARNLTGESTMIERPMYFLLPSLSVVLLGFPDQILGVLFFGGVLPLKYAPKWLYMTAAALEVMRQGVLPLTWLIFPDIRQSFKERLSCKICSEAKSSLTATNFSYRNLQND